MLALELQAEQASSVKSQMLAMELEAGAGPRYETSNACDGAAGICVCDGIL